MKRGLVASIGLLVACLASPAKADRTMTVWERVAEPELALAEQVHVEVQRRLALRGRFDLGEAQAMAARALLERYGAATSPDVRLRFDLGLVSFVLQDNQGARTWLAQALREAPDHPMAEEAWLRLAFACGHLGDHECERASYVAVLRHVTEEPNRATPTLNLAETEMHLGNLREAIDTYREAVRLASRSGSRDTAPMAVWGLAVALDRSGDRTSAEREARFARELERSLGMRDIMRSTNVFFVPAYEVSWYEGLAAAADARTTRSADDAALLLRSAERSFAAYVRAAERAGGDRWLALARVRLEAIRRELAEAERRSQRSPRPARLPVAEEP